MPGGPQHLEACADFIGKTPLSASFVAAGVLETENEPDRDAIKKAKVLYSSCMNESKSHEIF